MFAAAHYDKRLARLQSVVVLLHTHCLFWHTYASAVLSGAVYNVINGRFREREEKEDEGVSALLTHSSLSYDSSTPLIETGRKKKNESVAVLQAKWPLANKAPIF